MRLVFGGCIKYSEKGRTGYICLSAFRPVKGSLGGRKRGEREKRKGRATRREIRPADCPRARRSAPASSLQLQIKRCMHTSQVWVADERWADGNGNATVFGLLATDLVHACPPLALSSRSRSRKNLSGTFSQTLRAIVLHTDLR